MVVLSKFQLLINNRLPLCRSFLRFHRSRKDCLPELVGLSLGKSLRVGFSLRSTEHIIFRRLVISSEFWRLFLFPSFLAPMESPWIGRCEFDLVIYITLKLHWTVLVIKADPKYIFLYFSSVLPLFFNYRWSHLFIGSHLQPKFS